MYRRYRAWQYSSGGLPIVVVVVVVVVAVVAVAVAVVVVVVVVAVAAVAVVVVVFVVVVVVVVAVVVILLIPSIIFELFSFSFSVPRRCSDPGSLSRLSSPLPTTVCDRHVFGESTSADSSLVDARRTARIGPVE